MKLKKFLLRYAPKGVGLEIEDEGGGVEVRHKDLPEQLQEDSLGEIEAVVTRLIESEPGLLRQGRHQRALEKLLGRLYNVDVSLKESPIHGDAGAGKYFSAHSDGQWRIGQEVVLVGLEGKLQVHNGEIGKLLKFNTDKDKCEVGLTEEKSAGDEGTLKVKGMKHILPVATGGQLVTGTPVVICRLRNHAELNGWPGRILEKSEEQNRYVVRAAESGQLFRVKRDNLIQVEPDALSRVGMDEAFHMEYNDQLKAMKARLDQTQSGFGAAAPKSKDVSKNAPVTLPEVPGASGLGGLLQPGARVHLHGLKVATNFNGASAEVVSVDRGKSLYEVRLDDGSLKTVKAENIKPGPGSSIYGKTRRRGGDAVMQ